MKYVIKNCDNYTELGKDWTCRSTIQNRKGCYCCQDCTDCVMKQIVELCKGVKCPCEYKGADCWECTESGAKRLADKILQLLDIEEVE